MRRDLRRGHRRVHHFRRSQFRADVVAAERILTDMRVLVATPLALVIALLFVAGTAWGVTVFPPR